MRKAATLLRERDVPLLVIDDDPDRVRQRVNFDR
mgnify:CR=1 FL=1